MDAGLWSQAVVHAGFWFPDVGPTYTRASWAHQRLISSRIMNSPWFPAEKISHSNCETLLVRQQMPACDAMKFTRPWRAPYDQRAHEGGARRLQGARYEDGR